MCGLAGLFYPKNRTLSLLDEVMLMTDTLAHRGPDDSGYWSNEEDGIALGHRRLSILDVSKAGHQPMSSLNGRFILSYNGEIYNFKTLKAELGSLGREFKGNSDTETLLMAIEEWGVETTLQRCNGMFAFALWDKKEKQLYLGRDRLGQKPLYYGLVKGVLGFSSELKALRASALFNTPIDRGSVSLFMQYGYVPFPYSIFENIYKLVPGTYLVVSMKDIDNNRLPEPRKYWDGERVAQNGCSIRTTVEHSTVQNIEDALQLSVAEAMVSDVPIGAFLSGGVDSSLIVALMQAQSTSKIETFTIGFHEAAYNEAHHANRIAQHLGTDHHELYINQNDSRNVIPALPLMYDEPFADSSQIPTYLVSKLAGERVKVALSGDGGDEVFGGYNRYLWNKRVSAGIDNVPQPLRSAMRHLIQKISPSVWDRASKFLPLTAQLPLFGDKMHKFADVIAANSGKESYQKMTSLFCEKDRVVPAAIAYPTLLSNIEKWPSLPSLEDQMMLIDTLTYLAEDILTKVDRASMYTSLEVRVPILDHRVIEQAWALPAGQKIHKGVGKLPLREILFKHVPRELIERPKAGFGVPIGDWLRHELRDWAEDLLDETKLDEDPLLNTSIIRKRWDEHVHGGRNWQHQLWTVLMFQAWKQENRL
jgi:asparagine synthase (glutamine-hydrolysing)